MEIKYFNDGSVARIAAFYRTQKDDTAIFRASVEAEIVSRLSTEGSGEVTNSYELSQLVGELVDYVCQNAGTLMED